MTLKNTSVCRHPSYRYRYYSLNTENPLKKVMSVIEHPIAPVRFLVLDSPTNSTLKFYTNAFVEENVSTVIRCCKPTYDTYQLEERGINVIDLPFDDGSYPSDQIVKEWIKILDERKKHTTESKQPVTIAVHCVTGLGRAPLLIAIALVEFGMHNLDALEFVRERRKNALNKKQLKFVLNYERRELVKTHYKSFLRNIFTRDQLKHSPK